MEQRVALNQIRPGTFLLLCEDALLQEGIAFRLFYEPAEVLAVHQRLEPDDRALIRDGGLVVHAQGWEDRRDRWICLDMARRSGACVRICFPDDRHLVSPVEVWKPDEPVSVPAKRQRRRARRVVTDPVTGHSHDSRELSEYRLPAFWRDASVVWQTLSPRWIGDRGLLHAPRVLKAVSGVRQPLPQDIRASETAFYQNVTIGMATLCWKTATVFDSGEDDPLDTVLASLFNRLIEGFGSAAKLRAAAISFADERLSATGADHGYLQLFKAYRGHSSRGAVTRRRINTFGFVDVNPLRRC